MKVIKTSTIKSKTSFAGTPDFFIPRNKNLVKGSKIEFSIFKGWVDYPIHKTLDELNPKDLKPYNKEGLIYVYSPKYTTSDKMGIVTYKLVGVTNKKKDKRIMLIVKEITNEPFRDRLTYLDVKDNEIDDCGWVYQTTLENFNKANFNEEYLAHRNAKWVKLNPDDFKHLTGKVYTNSRNKD